MSSTTLLPPSAQNALSTVTSSVAHATSQPTTAPSTPTASKTFESKPSPGTFRHPRLAEIVRRQNKTTLTQGDVRNAAVNFAALVLSFAFRNIIAGVLMTLLKISPLSNDTSNDFTRLVFLVARVLFVVNMVVSLRQGIPAIARKDDMEDIPLTPSQRHLLGLPPSTKTTPAGSALAPSTGYITPPRYHRRLSGSASPSGTLNGSGQADSMSADRRSVSANYSASPLSTSRYTLGFSPSPSVPQTQPYNRTGRTASGSPFSPSGSPLFHKAIDRQRRQSQDFDFGRSTGLGRSNSVKEVATDRGSPMPKARKGVNFKWLYDQNYSFGNGPSRGLSSSQSMNF